MSKEELAAYNLAISHAVMAIRDFHPKACPQAQAALVDVRKEVERLRKLPPEAPCACT